MTPENWRRAKQIFEAAMDLRSGARAEFLDGACGQDPEMRAEIESLLDAHDEVSGFLEFPALDRADAADPEKLAGAPLTGARLGNYQIVQEVGEGGMGVVYQAVRDDDQFRKLVAIKVIKRGLDTRHVLRRFQTERQILAHLDHPNIGRLLDGGTTADGRPYFVMEFIAGRAIDEYCEQRGMTIHERLRLFVKVCSAVQYAHQNLVVHRDLKPSNILVTEDGEPKLLDFGIAKVLGDDREHTVTLRAMTPEYASPEQVLGEPIGTASDIYSLGVLLYQLLTGRRPYELKNRTPLEAAEVICGTEPARPSSAIAAGNAYPARLRRQLEGDLDNIVLMTLRKEPGRRYHSAEQLASDIQRYFEGRPVAARTDTIWYRTAKFVRRNRLGVVFVALLFASLLAGIVATAWQAGAARAERARAELHFQEVRQLSNSLIFEMHDAIQNLPGSTPARELLVKRALEYLDRLARSAATDALVQRELAVAYRKISEVEGSPYAASLGKTDAAVKSGRKALAGALLSLGDTRGALENFRMALPVFETLAAEDPTNAQAASDLGFILRDGIGDALARQGDAAGSLELYRKALAGAKQVSAADPASAYARRNLMISYAKVGQATAALGRPAASIEAWRNALAAAQTLCDADPKNAQARGDLAFCRIGLGDAELSIGNVNAAAESYRRALEAWTAVASSDPMSTQAREGIAEAKLKTGDAELRAGRPSQALANYSEAATIRERLAKEDPLNAEVCANLAASYARVGTGHAVLARNQPRPARAAEWRQAQSWLQRSVEAWRELGKRSQLTAQQSESLEKSRRELAAVEAGLRRF